jgi:hypothetical protein
VTDNNAEDLVVRVRIVNDAPAGAGQVDEDGNPMGDDEVEVGQEDDVFLKRLRKACSKVSNCEVLTTLKVFPSWRCEANHLG